MKRQREMQSTMNNYRGGDAYEERRNRAYAARARDTEVTAEMCGRLAEAMEEGKRNVEGGNEEEEGRSHESGW